MQGSWTSKAPLPGGEMGYDGFDAFSAALHKVYDWLEADILKRLARAYGSLAHQILGSANSKGDLGIHFGGGLYEREVEYLVHGEFAKSAEDVLFRRSKLGLHLDEPEKKKLVDWFRTRASSIDTLNHKA